MEIRRIGFIGIGNMGAPMAANLAKAGFQVSVYDLRETIVQAFARDHDVRIASSLGDVARAAECIITMLPDDKAVKQAVLGDGGDCIADGLEAGHIIVEMSTSDPTATQALGAALSLRGVHVVDAPVMGGVVFARDGTLDIMAGGDAELVELLAPVFKALGRKVYHCGPLGSGHALKAINNYVNACSLLSAIEGLAIGRTFGIDTAMMVETMQAMCTGRNHPIDKKVIPHVLTRTYRSGMAMGFIAKDLRIAVEAAHRIGAAAPLAERVSELWDAAAKSLGPTLDQTEIVRYWEQASGVTL
jgi:3-hydroxyisobutyrate dehydrogenase